MKTEYIMDQILPILKSVDDDEEKLTKILNFLIDEIYDGEEEQPEIPEKYKEVVKEIAQCVDAGFICYFNSETKEYEQVNKEFIDDPEAYEKITGESWTENFVHESWDRCLTIEPPNSNESFQFMECFTEVIEDKKLRSKLIAALSRSKPFANFKHIIDNSRYREYWFKFKQEQLEQMVWDIIEMDMEDMDVFDGVEVVNGIFNDDGTPINAQDIPIPNLCVICTKHQEEDWEENLFCLLNRNDQKESDDFKCGAFDKI